MNSRQVNLWLALVLTAGRPAIYAYAFLCIHMRVTIRLSQVPKNVLLVSAAYGYVHIEFKSQYYSNELTEFTTR